MTELRVLTYNIEGARHRRPLAEVVRAVSPDVLVVNETPHRMRVVRRLRDRLVHEWGLEPVVDGRLGGGNMVCLGENVSVSQVAVRRLPQPRFQPHRGVVVAQCEVAGTPFGVVGVHLSLRRARERRSETARALAEVDRLQGPVVVAGDLNEPAGDPSWRALRGAGFADHAAVDALTFPAHAPTRRIDAVLVRGAPVVDHRVPDLDPRLLAAASDHLPVLATLRLP